MNTEELMKRYQELANKPLDSPSMQNESGEFVSPLIQTTSLRILLIRTFTEPDVVTVEVEVWLPGRHANNSSIKSNHSGASPENENLSSTLSQMITYLQYLHRLNQAGFALDVIKHDCLWTASQAFEKLPSREMFELLLPP